MTVYPVECGDRAAWWWIVQLARWHPAWQACSGACSRQAEGLTLEKSNFAASWRSVVHSWGHESVKFWLWLFPVRLVWDRKFSRHFSWGCLVLRKHCYWFLLNLAEVMTGHNHIFFGLQKPNSKDQQLVFDPFLEVFPVLLKTSP